MSDHSSLSQRRHDLDALRAFAMLLGIALHSAMSFTGFGWIVQDTRTSFTYVFFMLLIHGFRMQLFMMVSGYFTMMVYRRRGLKSLLKQRFSRVFLPCLLGLVTVVPAMDLASVWASGMNRGGNGQNVQKGTQPQDYREAIASRNIEAVREMIAAGKDLNLPDERFRLFPMAWACLYGDIEMTRLLIDSGADVKAVSADRNTVVHHASFMGYPEILRLVIDRGADSFAKNNDGSTGIDSAFVPMETTSYIAKLIEVPLRENGELLSGRVQCIKLLEKLGVRAKSEASESANLLGRIRGQYADFLGSERFKTSLTRHGQPFHLILTSFFHHLWFLWFLCWFVIFFAIGTIIFSRFQCDHFASLITTSRYRLPVLVCISMLPQLFMGTIKPSFGPDTSTGIIPEPHLLAYYFIFFGFGAIYYDHQDLAPSLGRKWKRIFPFAILLLFPAGLVTMNRPVIGGMVQLFYTWSMVFAITGCFESCIKEESRPLRYLSDSAYWLYLVHLPLVVIFQGVVKNWPVPSLIKLIMICIAVTFFGLISYEYMVRDRWIGRLLNGPSKKS